LIGAALVLLTVWLAWAQKGDPQNGKVVYERKCMLCHGEKGDGKGPAAEELSPAPRDFVSGVYKIRTTANKIPSDEDLFKIITDVPGTHAPWKVLPKRTGSGRHHTFAADSSETKKQELPKEVVVRRSPAGRDVRGHRMHCATVRAVTGNARRVHDEASHCHLTQR
jgi:hypothetical protein